MLLSIFFATESLLPKGDEVQVTNQKAQLSKIKQNNRLKLSKESTIKQI